MLTKNRKTNRVSQTLNSENNLMYITEDGFMPYEIEETNLTVEELELTVNEDDRIILEGDIDVNQIWFSLKQALDQLVDLKNKVIPYVEQTLEELPKNAQEILADQLGLQTIPPYNHYQTILDKEYYYCNLRDSAPINEFFRAYWLFMWFEKRAHIPIPSIVLGDIPKDKILKYLDTRFSVKYLKEGSTKKDYFYQLYLKVQPYLIRYFDLEKFEQQNLFSDEL